MDYSLDIDKYGLYGIYSGKKITIYNLHENNIDINNEYIEVINKRIITKKTILGNNSHLNAIFINEDDDYKFNYSNIVKFGVHSRVSDSFINVRGNTILLGNANKLDLEYLSNQMLNIDSFDWSPHFSTGTFVTSSEDSLIRICDIRSKNFDYSFLSFYKTTKIEWNPLNSYLLLGINENGNFLSIYDIRVLKSIGIIPKYFWSNDKYSKISNNSTASWLPLSSHKILVNDISSIGILDISCALNSSRIIANENFENSQISIEEKSKFCKIKFDQSLLGQINLKYPNIHNENPDEILKSNSNLSINTYDFIPGTNKLIIHNENDGRLFSCEIIDHVKDLKFSELNCKFENNINKLFIRDVKNLICFVSTNETLINNDEEKNEINLIIKKNQNLFELSKQENNFNYLNLSKICLDWFIRDINYIYDKIKSNQKIIHNLSLLSIESQGKIIIRLSKSHNFNSKFTLEDNTHSNTLLNEMDSFEFNISLNIPQDKNKTILVTYYITENTISLLNEFVYDIINKFQLLNLPDNIAIHSLNDEILQKSDSYFKFDLQDSSQYFISPIPMRIFMNGSILANKEFERINNIFEIKIDGKKFRYQEDELQYSSSLLDWTSIFANWPNIVFKNEVIGEINITRNDLDLISFSSKTVENFQDQILSSEKFLNKISYTIHDLDKLIISNSNYLLIARMNESSLIKNEKFDNLVTNINSLLGKVYNMTDIKFTYNEFSNYAFIILNWLIKVIYTENRKRAIYDIQHYCLNSIKKSNYNFNNMFVSPTLLHTYFRRKEQLTLNKEDFIELSEIYRLNPNDSYQISINNKTFDFNKLIFFLKELYLQIRNNYRAQILVTAIKKLINYLERFEKDIIYVKSVKPFSFCYVCFEQVYGLYTRCRKCKHGGHNRHIKDWFLTNDMCPEANCKCNCKSE